LLQQDGFELRNLILVELLYIFAPLLEQEYLPLEGAHFFLLGGGREIRLPQFIPQVIFKVGGLLDSDVAGILMKQFPHFGEGG
jgi:hypothetical protein